MIAWRFLFPLVGVLFAAVVVSGVGARTGPSTSDRARQFIARHETRVRPLEQAVAQAWWNANISGRDEDFKKKAEAQYRIDEALADREAFKELMGIKEAGGLDDPVLVRQFEVLYLAYLEKQVDPALLKQMVAKSVAVDKAFNVFRAKVDGKEMPDSEVRRVLKSSKDSERRKAVWEASKAVGHLVEKDLKELVGLRNRAAAQLGFNSFHAMQLYLNEQDGAELIRLFDELDNLTREPFHAAKADIDAKLAVDCGVRVTNLMPWHYHDPFFQETPAVFPADLDEPFGKADLIQLCRDFYKGIGLPIDPVIPRSDLYEKGGKNPHAFCTDIDRAGDVRVLANVVPNVYWISTLLHEFGHSVYSSLNIPVSVPYVLCTEAHILTTEGVAMMFERVTRRRLWLEKMGLKVSDPAAFEEAGSRALRYDLLIFSRWCQVMLRFEKAMYENPDQDLNNLWWDLVEKYQLLRRPPDRSAPDYASKIHIVSTPVYYHNYMMGQLFASQVHHAISHDVMNGADPHSVVYVGTKAVGDFMRKRVFEPGKLLKWNALTRHATGEDLTAKAFAEDFKRP
jgi:peptidyl-dipeptidase A